MLLTKLQLQEQILTALTPEKSCRDGVAGKASRVTEKSNCRVLLKGRS